MDITKHQLLDFANNLPDDRIGKEEFINFVNSLEDTTRLEFQLEDQIPEVKNIYAEYVNQFQENPDEPADED